MCAAKERGGGLTKFYVSAKEVWLSALLIDLEFVITIP